MSITKERLFQIEKENKQFQKLWEQFWKTPDGKKRLDQAKKADEFRSKLRQCLDRAREAREDNIESTESE
jgi:hypothetical protein